LSNLSTKKVETELAEETRNEQDKLSIHYIEATQTVEKRMRNVFIGSLGLSILVAIDLAFLARRGDMLGTVIRVSFPPLLLWSFMLTAYAFYVLWRLADERGRILKSVATTDVRTGVKSCGFIRTFLQSEYERGIETGQPVAVLYVDLENLELVNRKFGHTVGDIVLKGVAKRIEKSLPPGGMVGRVSGDEFVVVLPATRTEKANSVAAALEECVRDYTLDLGPKGRVDFLGCRVGVIACSRDAGFADDIISIAQKAVGQPDGR